MKTPSIVSPQEWDVARQELLVEEKQLTRARDALAAKRRRMPWMAVEKEYRFDGPEGPVSLLDLFEGRRQCRPPRPPERAGHDARVRFARSPGRDPGPEGAHGLGADPVVHDHRRL